MVPGLFLNNWSYSRASLMLQSRLNIINRVAAPASTRTTG